MNLAATGLTRGNISPAVKIIIELERFPAYYYLISKNLKTSL